jgi:hypothetical protein
MTQFAPVTLATLLDAEVWLPDPEKSDQQTSRRAADA